MRAHSLSKWGHATTLKRICISAWGVKLPANTGHLYAPWGMASHKAFFPTYRWFNQSSATAHMPTHRHQEEVTEYPHNSSDLHDNS